MDSSDYTNQAKPPVYSTVWWARGLLGFGHMLCGHRHSAYPVLGESLCSQPNQGIYA